MTNFKLNKIDAVLKYGQFFSGKWIILLYSLIIWCSIVPISTVIFSILVLFGKETFYDDIVISFFGGNLISLSIILGTIYVLYKNNKLKKKIILWLEDAVELSAQTTCLDRFRTLGHPVAETKLQVKFKYFGITKVQSSYDDTKKDHWYKRNGFFKILSKYANRTIKILYSPKYDQVIILKD